jgi:hypothetical protein
MGEPKQVPGIADGAEDDRVVYKGYTLEQLRRVFDAVADPKDWRAPIAATMSGEVVLAACAAIEFFTATTPRVSLDTRTMTYLVESEGYRAGPAGP